MVEPETSNTNSPVLDTEKITKNKWNKELEERVLAIYLAEKPSKWIEHRKLSKKLKRQLTGLSMEAIASALIYVREQNGDFWRSKSFSFTNLASNDKISEYAEKHNHLMKVDIEYRLRAEGLAYSKDSDRKITKKVVDKEGNELSPFSIEMATAYATDPFLRLMIDQ
ncbi:MAG: hypothetical protein F6K65_23405 [Moorea sp. SIO3C2]|nr:hypothetical protein [Moorena sp. SIO3C2]